MTVEPWLLGVVSLFLLVDLLTVYYVARAGDGGDDGGAAEPADAPVAVAAEDEDDGTSVVCPDCGAENDAGYRYCRECAGELPGRGAVAPAVAAGDRRDAL